MVSSFNNVCKKNSIDNEIKKTWIQVSHYIKLIQTEFDILYAYRPNYTGAKAWPLQNEMIINV
jgi:hypothetical protein